MSLKTFGIIVYILFIAMVTYFVATFSEASKVIDFLGDREEELLADDAKLVLASIIANQHDGTDAYTLASPLFDESFESEDYKIHLMVYPVAVFKGNQTNNMIAILAKDINIDDDTAAIDDEYHDINISISFDRNITIGDTVEDQFNETFVSIFEDGTRLFLIDTSMLQTPTGQAQIAHISVSYATTLGTSMTLVNLTNSSVETPNTTDLFDSSYNRELNVLTSNALDIVSNYGIQNIDQNVNLYYDATLISDLNSYNWYVILYIGIELVVVAILSYFIYFHKIVMRRVRVKKNIKQAEEQKRYEKIKAEIKENHTHDVSNV